MAVISGQSNGVHAGLVNGNSVNGDSGKGRSDAMPLAIVGMACRFSGGVDNPEKLWQLVSEGRSAWSAIDETRFRHEAFYHKRNDGYSNAIQSFIKGGYFLEQDVALFDNSFFSLTADAAAAMDPQIRMQLELTYEAIESAGIPMEKIVGSNTAVFSGSFTHDYHDNMLADPLRMPRTFITSTYAAMMANRISYHFDLKGPSSAVDTGCSTSLVALYMAAQTLRSGEADCAIVGGSALHLNPEVFSSLSSLGTCGPDGKCYAFDHRAHGYGRGEGLATIVVKRLDDALKSGDPICAVIREVGTNQDGKTATITSPDEEAQRRLIEDCYRRAGLDPSETAVVEAHGTGTKQGDRTEAHAIAKAISQGRPADQPVYLASVKTNIGHTEATSGLASLIKMVKSLEHGKVAPSINFEKPNAEIDLDRLGLKLSSAFSIIPRTLEDWPSQGIRRTSINNFGYGGANSHVILEEAAHHLQMSKAQVNGCGGADGRKLFLLSARDATAARGMAANLSQYLKDTENVSFRDLAYTLGQRRSRLNHTLFATAGSTEELAETLSDKSLKLIAAPASGSAPRLGFVFNGQGAQWFGMGRELMAQYPTFLKTIEECDAAIQDFGADWSLLDELRRPEETSRVNQVRFSMPMSCAVQMALVCLLEEWGIKPDAVCSHSSGEVAAAFAAGALDLREAMACTYFRGLINADNVGLKGVEGAMAAVGLGPDEAQRYIDEAAPGKVVIACVNSPSSVTISGDRSGIDELQAKFNAEGIFARKLKVQAAFHSHHMFALEDDYRAALNAHLHAGKRSFKDGVRFYSPVQGGLVDDATELGPEQWIRNMVQPVLFAQSFHGMMLGEAENGQSSTPKIDVVIEIGPHGALAGPIRQCLSAPELKVLDAAYGSCLTRAENAISTAQGVVGLLLAKGLEVDIARVNFPGGGFGLRALSGLPSYPWSHSSRFWNESRISREHRFRKHPVHDLLGHRVPGLSGQLPVWRHVLRASEVPWTYDHVVQSNIVYPGSGYIAMAIEAMRQLHDDEEHRIVGYSFRDVDILKAMIVPEDDDGVEVQLFLEPVDDNSLVEGWRQFHIYSAATETDDWAEMAKGLIALEFGATAGSTSRPYTFKGTSSLGIGADMEAYPKKMSPGDLFKSLHAVGVNHGPRFQNLTRIRMGDDTAFTTFDVADSAATMPHGFQQGHVIHPITLDAVFQSAYPTLSPEKRKLVGTAIPRHVKRLYISAAGSSEAGQPLSQYSSLLNCNRQGFEVSAAVLPDGSGSGTPVIEVEGMRFQSLGASVEDEETSQEQLCMLTEWKESFSLNRSDLLKTKLQHAAPEEEKALAQEITRATYHLVHDALSQLTEDDVAGLEWHHKALYEWMLLLRSQGSANELSPRSSRWATTSTGVKEMLYDKVAKASVHGALVVKVGRNMVGILRKEIAPLELMLQNQLLYKFYQEALRFGRSTAQAGEVVRAIAAEHPRARYLEIGAGTGGCTMPVLQALGGGDTGLPIQFEHYDFTDVSSGFFTAAKERFQAWDGLIDYKTLNIEDDLEAQDFGSGSAKYDVIVAAQVLHATKNLSHTMKNVRRLLKDGGKLILVETTRDTPDLTLIFGTVPGWWLSDEPERKRSPNIGLEAWDRILAQAGFSGLDLNVWDSEDADHQSLSCLVSTATGGAPEVDLGSEDLVLVYGDQDAAPPSGWHKELTASLSEATGLAVDFSTLSGLDATGKLCVFLSGLSGAPQQFHETKFEQIRRMVMSAKGLLWVTTGATMDCKMPDNAIHLGLLRTARIEDSSRVFASLDLDPGQSAWRTETQAIISRVLVAAMDKSKTPGTVDFEYAERNSQVLVPRLHRDAAENEAFHGGEAMPAAAPRAPELVKFVQQPDGEASGRALRLHVDVPGLLDSIVFRDDAEARQPLPDGWVEIEPRAFGLNFRDIMVAMGKLDEPVQELGNECGGVVTRVSGAGVPPGLLGIGDRVCALTLHGHFANRVRVPWTSVARIPDHVSFEEAASFVVVFVTAYCALLEAGRAEKGETVLVHAAAGGVGQACIVLAQNRGVEVFATVGSREKRDFLRATYGIPDDHIFSSRDASFVADVLAATGGRGVDIVINSLAGRLLDESWNLLAPYGRFVEIGKKDIHSNKALGMAPFRKALSFVHVDIINLVDHKPQAAQRILQELVHMLGDRDITNIAPVTSFSLADIGRAFRVMQAGKHIGKIVIVPGPEDLVKAAPPVRAVELPGDVTYLVIGGLSGIGQSISRWLVNHGAKHLLLVSRNAASRSKNVQFAKEVAATGATVTIKDCDIGERAMLQSLVDEHQRSGEPPIRGVIHSGMVLDDSVLERMTYAQWHNATNSKITGTRNLDAVFGSTLDFFLVLSSANGVLGCTSQSNYAAGGSYQDALVRRRAAAGLAGVVLDLGIVNSVGFVAETAGVKDRLVRGGGHRPLEEAEVLALVACALQRPRREPRAAQVVAGITGAAVPEGEPRFAALSDPAAGSGSGRHGAGSGSGGAVAALHEQMAAAETVDDGVVVVRDTVVAKLAEMFVIPAADIDPGQPLAKYGVDSLVAVELRNWLVPRARIEMSIFDLLGSASLTELAEKVMQRSWAARENQ